MQYFPSEYSTLSYPSLLQHLITNYSVLKIKNITFLKRGFNDTYMVEGEDDKYILRVYKHNWRSKKSIENELNLLNYLHEKGISVSIPILDNNRNYIHSINAIEGIRNLVLFSYAQGETVRKLTTELSYQIGYETSKIHLLTTHKTYQDVAFNFESNTIFNDCFKTIVPILSNYKKELNYLHALHQSFETIFSSINQNELSMGICHGDLQAENFHINENKITFFDFDFFGNGPLIYDIGVFIWYDHKNKPIEIIKSFLKGYQSVKKLSKTELDLIHHFATLRAIFQMTLFCKISDGKQLPLWPADQAAAFIHKIEKWHNKPVSHFL